MKSLKNQALITEKSDVAERFFARLRGLIGKRDLKPGDGMLFPRNNSIHMWFMSIPIDVVFLKKETAETGEVRYFVTSVHEGLRPWRVLPLRDGRASETLELPKGTVSRHAIESGDELCLSWS